MFGGFERDPIGRQQAPEHRAGFGGFPAHRARHSATVASTFASSSRAVRAVNVRPSVAAMLASRSRTMQIELIVWRAEALDELAAIFALLDTPKTIH